MIQLNFGIVGEESEEVSGDLGVDDDIDNNDNNDETIKMMIKTIKML